MKTYDEVAYASGILIVCMILFNLMGLISASQITYYADILFVVVDVLFLIIAWRRRDRAVAIVSLVSIAVALWLLCS